MALSELGAHNAASVTFATARLAAYTNGKGPMGAVRWDGCGHVNVTLSPSLRSASQRLRECSSNDSDGIC